MFLRSDRSVRLFFLTLALAISTAARAEKARPNVLFICVDDLKPQPGCYGDPIAHSPNIDRLAARGMVFTRAYCNQAVCGPSRNSLLPGAPADTADIEL